MSDDRDRLGADLAAAARAGVDLSSSELAAVARSELVPPVIRKAATEAFLRQQLARDAARVELSPAVVEQRQADAATATRGVMRMLRETFDAGERANINPANLDLVAEAVNVAGDPRVKKLAIEAAVLERDLAEAKRMNLPLTEIERATERALRLRAAVAQEIAKVAQRGTFADLERAESPFWRSQAPAPRVVKAPPAVAYCDHKFVDSESCVKCGWTPPRRISAVPTDTFRRYFDDD